MKAKRLLGRGMFKYTTSYEAMWTKYLAPGVFVGYWGGWLVQRRIKGMRLDEIEYAEQKPILLNVVSRLGELHRRALSSDAPRLRSMTDWYSNLYRIWRTPRYSIDNQEWQIFECLQPLLSALSNVDTQGVFKDANPRNWIVSSGTAFAIDFGAMSTASFSSDFAQLIDYYKPIDESLWDELIQYWADSFGAGAPVRQIKIDLPTILIYSALCRIPFHERSQRRQWDLRAANRARQYGWKKFADTLKAAAEEPELVE